MTDGTIWHPDIIQRQGSRTGGLLCKIIRDTAGPVDGSEISIVSDGALRVLHMGRGTILIHDQERSELLGFVPRNVKAKELTSSLIPVLLDMCRGDSRASAAFTK